MSQSEPVHIASHMISLNEFVLTVKGPGKHCRDISIMWVGDGEVNWADAGRGLPRSSSDK